MKKVFFLMTLLLGTQLSAAHEAFLSGLERAVGKAQLANTKPYIACEGKTEEGNLLASPDACLENPNFREAASLLKQFLIQLAQEADTAYVTKWLGKVKLGEQIYEQAFLIKHSGKIPVKDRLAFGPQYDQQFDYTRPDYYPKGSVKITLTKSIVDAIRLYYEEVVPRYGKESPQARGLKSFLGLELYREVLQGWQFHSFPVLSYRQMDFAQLTEMLKNRQLVAQILWGSEQDVNYDEDAQVFVYKYMASSYKELESFGAVFKRLVTQPDFSDKYAALTGSFQAYLTQQIQRTKEAEEEEATARMEKIRTFNEVDKYRFQGKVASLQAWEYMVRVNNQLRFFKNCKEIEKEVREKYVWMMDLSVAQWRGRNVDNPQDVRIMEAIQQTERETKGLKEIKAAALKEFEDFEKMCQIKL